MAKKVLIISPYFPPSNAADMQRIRMSLPYFENFGWRATIVSVDPKHSDVNKDPILNQSILSNVDVHLVDALNKKLTSKLGLGSIALRALPFFKRKVDSLLKREKYDLIYFSTTQFPVCALGPYWKRKFKIPFVIDMQDPWHSDYYKGRPKSERPPKYWFSSRLNKWLEKKTMKEVDGLISVSEGYIKTLASRYFNCSHVPSKVITFGSFLPDLSIAQANLQTVPSILPEGKANLNIVYIGRGGKDMQDGVSILFSAFKKCLEKYPDWRNLFHFHFIGTSYASEGKGIKTIEPLAEEMGMGGYVTERTDRISFFQSLNTLSSADALFIPGSNDPQYTASKIYPYVMVRKPLLAIFHSQSSVVGFLEGCRIGTVLTFEMEQSLIFEKIENFLMSLKNKNFINVEPVKEIEEKYSALEMTRKQCDLFEKVLEVANCNSLTTKDKNLLTRQG